MYSRFEGHTLFTSKMHREMRKNEEEGASKRVFAGIELIDVVR